MGKSLTALFRRKAQQPLTFQEKYRKALTAINATSTQIAEINKQTQRVIDRRQHVEVMGKKFDSQTDMVAKDAEEIITNLLGKKRANKFFKICNE
jgi:hypothetical protein